MPAAQKAGAERPLYLGLDLGSVSLKAVVLTAQREVVFERYRRTEGRPWEAARALWRELMAALPEVRLFGAYVTGSGKETLATALGAGVINEIVAHAGAAWTLYPEARSVIEIGGQDSKIIHLGHDADGRGYVADHAFNELCAAGTGAFLDQQAGRLGLTIDAFAALAGAAPRSARLAGRCTVFAKSDMIHLQQQACPTDEIAAGLCLALARNYLASLCHGVAPQAPILFQGGVAANAGVRRAFLELLNIPEEQLIRPTSFLVMGALGAAMEAIAHPWAYPRDVRDLAPLLEQANTVTEAAGTQAPLRSSAISVRGFTLATAAAEPCVLGLDVGSVSTKAVALNERAECVASCYLRTAGQPLVAVRSAMRELRRQAPHVCVRAIVTTGSGRHLAAHALRADLAVDEITAQACSARACAPETDTIIEIGGQDSKLICLHEGHITRFQMNRACAAGTGSFLEEQAGRLGLDIKTAFADAALSATAPVELGSRCTVFMDSDLVHHIQRGASKEDLCAGLAYAIARNYLEKVVGSRPIGAQVLFQGGVARNAAVHAAFEALIGHPIAVHPAPELSGAWGAALLAQGVQSVYPARGWEAFDFVAETSTFPCGGCENVCEIQRITFDGQRRAYFGSVCGRYERGEDTPIPASDLFAERERLLLQARGDFPAPSRGTLGLPYALSLHDHWPFWNTFLSALGYKVVRSQASSGAIVERGLAKVPAEFCYPMKVLFGHVHSLLEKGVTRLFIPHVRLVPPPGEKEPRYACPYTQAAPYVVRSHVRAEVLSLEYLVPGEEEAWLKAASHALDIAVPELRAALARALEAQQAFLAACREAGARALAALHHEKRQGVVLLGRPYNTNDRYANLQIVRHLKALDVEPIPYDFLPLEEETLPRFWSRVRWNYGRQLLKAARLIKRDPQLSAVIVTNFGCGPDSFVDQYLESELSQTPNLVVEMDEHQGVAGLVTRLEAFVHTLASPRILPPVFDRPDPGRATRPLRELTYYIPYVADHAFAFSGALKAAGCRTVMLPPTDDESWQLGLRHAYGRECHPFISFTGDILKAARRPGFVADEACYWGPSYFGSCLLPQYPLAMRLILDRVGLEGVNVINIADPSTMSELGNAYVVRLALGLYAIDRLFKWKVESEPYEVEPGSVQRVHEANLRLIEAGLAEGRFFRALKRAVADFAAVKLGPDAGTRPGIGVIGDVYTRVNAHANDGLYARLEEMGFEVWPSCSLIDVSFLGMEQLSAELARRGKPFKAGAARSLIPFVAWLRGRVDRHFPVSIRTPQERQYPAVSAAANTYASHWIDKALSLNISRVEELDAAGAAGAVQAMCHNCMLGTVTEALMKPMAQDHPDLALCNLVFDGLKSTHTRNRLEAFCHRVHHRTRASGTDSRTPK